mgnify:CR=1 FL=1
MVNETSPVKRARATRAEMRLRQDALAEIVREIEPCTVRQVFYQATVRGVVDKTEAGYAKVQIALVEMRRSGLIPFDNIVDNTRWQRKPRSYGDPAQALEEVADFYRKDLWREADAYVEVWLEKDALSGVVLPTTAKFDVPLMTARGYASLSFLHTAAEAIAAQDRPAYIYHLGDFDPSGLDAGNKIDATLRELAPDAEIHFERLAVNPDQIRAWNLPARPTKTSDTRARAFGSDVSVELDAIHPDQLRRLVHDAVERHLPAHAYDVLKTAEASERTFLREWAGKLRQRAMQAGA